MSETSDTEQVWQKNQYNYFRSEWESRWNKTFSDIDDLLDKGGIKIGNGHHRIVVCKTKKIVRPPILVDPLEKLAIEKILNTVIWEGNMQTKNIYRLPIDLDKVTSSEPDLISHVGDLVYSIDYDALEGISVYVAMDGVVISVKDDSNIGGLEQKFENEGNFIEILHDNEEVSEYEHIFQHSSKVHVGDKVTIGDVIAEVGNTGWSECPHLHFMVYPKGNEYKTLEIRFE